MYALTMALTGDRRREYQRKRVAKCRADYLADKCCAVCSTTERLEIDHIDPTTKVTHNVWSWSEERRLEELAKCQVLCREHHLEKTSAQFTRHGISGYKKRGCRCDVCREAKRVENARRSK